MLQHLHIENIAVIERADISFSGGFCVLTGETGAGKSIVIDALNAVLGGRVSRDLVRTGVEKASVTAVFGSYGAEDWCRENDVDPEDGELILQRRIGADGKSGCRVCGVPVTAAQLRELGALLLDIHGQNDGRQLMDESRHRAYLDRFGDLDAALSAFKARYTGYREIVREIERLRVDEAEKERLAENLQYRVKELEQARIRPGEEAELTARRELLRHSEKLTEALDGAYLALYNGERNAIALCAEAQAFTSRAAAFCPELSEAEARVSEASFALVDAAELVRDLRDHLNFSPEEYDALETRLALLRRLEKKYGAQDDAGLSAVLEGSRARLEELAYAGDRLELLSRDREKRLAETLDAAKTLSAARKKAGAELEKRITAELTALSMPSVQFRVEIEPVGGEPGFDGGGGDEVRFLMSANLGEMTGPISRIASGGELSRIMLAMKNVFAEKDAVPTLVFDEIDAGVSGIAAQRVGEKLASLSGRKQVLCVTHLPQIAAMADAHYSVEKTEKDGRTSTAVVMLDEDGRLRELARLHGGDNITETTLRSAAEQLRSAEKFKRGARNDQQG
jgi:DNA repair protein RecN (Recombination protein N)